MQSSFTYFPLFMLQSFEILSKLTFLNIFIPSVSKVTCHCCYQHAGEVLLEFLLLLSAVRRRKILQRGERNECAVKDFQHLKLYFISFFSLKSINPLHPDVNMRILHTVLYTFPEMLTGRFCFTDQKLLLLVIISFILMTLMCDSGVILWEKLDACHSQGLKG